MRFINSEFSRFLFFGAVNAVLSYVAYLVLLLFLSYPISYTMAYVTGIFTSYYMNATLVFQERARLAGALKYPLVYLVQYLLGALLLCVLVERLKLSSRIAPIPIVMLTVPVTFFLSRYVIKRG